MAAPKAVIDQMLAEKYGWTPQEIDDVPQRWMDEMMIVLNVRMSTNTEIQERRAGSPGGPPTPPTIGAGIMEKRSMY